MKIDSRSLNVLIKINGEVKLVPQNISILNLLKLYKINPERVVIELNKVVLKKEYYENTKLKENDELEIITFVGGG